MTQQGKTENQVTWSSAFNRLRAAHPSALSLFRGGMSSGDMMLKISYLVLQVLDLSLTLLAMSLGAHELNPVIRASLSSPLQLTVLKGGLPLLIAWLLPGKFLIPGIVFLAVVVGWNVKELIVLWF